jgi:hypothetical protein
MDVLYASSKNTHGMLDLASRLPERRLRQVRAEDDDAGDGCAGRRDGWAGEVRVRVDSPGHEDAQVIALRFRGC